MRRTYITTGAQENNFAGATGPGWMYEVPAGTGGVYERGASGQYWATETIGTATWAQTLNVASPGGPTHRALIYGFHPQTFNTNDPQISKFEHFRFRHRWRGAHVDAVNIGLCAIRR